MKQIKMTTPRIVWSDFFLKDDFYSSWCPPTDPILVSADLTYSETKEIPVDEDLDVKNGSSEDVKKDQKEKVNPVEELIFSTLNKEGVIIYNASGFKYSRDKIAKLLAKELEEKGSLQSSPTPSQSMSFSLAAVKDLFAHIWHELKLYSPPESLDAIARSFVETDPASLLVYTSQSVYPSQLPPSPEADAPTSYTGMSPLGRRVDELAGILQEQNKQIEGLAKLANMLADKVAGYLEEKYIPKSVTASLEKQQSETERLTKIFPLYNTRLGTVENNQNTQKLVSDQTGSILNDLIEKVRKLESSDACVTSQLAGVSGTVDFLDKRVMGTADVVTNLLTRVMDLEEKEEKALKERKEGFFSSLSSWF